MSATTQADRSIVQAARGAVGTLRTELERSTKRARNGVRLATGRIAPPPKASTPHDVVWRSGRARLLHYRNDNVRYATPLLLIYSLHEVVSDVGSFAAIRFAKSSRSSSRATVIVRASRTTSA